MVFHTKLQRTMRTGYNILDESENLIFTMNTEQTAKELIRIIRNNCGKEIGRCIVDRNKFFPSAVFYVNGIKVGTAKCKKTLKKHTPPEMDFEGIQIETNNKVPLEIYALINGKTIMTIECPIVTARSKTIKINLPEDQDKLVVLAMGLLMMIN